MADTNFNINLKVNVDKGKSTQQVNAIKKSLEKKKIKLKIDTSAMKKQLNDFKKSLTGVNKSLNNAFKLDSKNLKNLQDLKKVLNEINKLSKKTQVKVTSSKETSQVNSDLEKQKNKYMQLLKMKQSLEKQMAGTSNATSYSNLKSQLELVTKEAEKCKTKISELSKLKLKTDMTKSMSSQFQTVQKQAQNLKTSLENTLKNTNLTSTQKKDLNELLTTINKVSQTRFRLKTSDAEAQIQKLVQEITNVSSKYSKIKIDINATSNIEKTKKSVDSMINKLKQAQNTKVGTNSFINSKELNKLVSDAEKLKQNLKNINMKGNVATETTKIIKQLDTISNKFKNLQNVAKLDMKLGGGATTANKQIDNLISKIKTIQTQKIGGDAFIDETKLTNLITRLQSLKTDLSKLDVNSEKVVTEFEQIKNSINKTETELKELQSAGNFELKLEQSKNTLDSLGNQIDKLEQKIKKLGGDESTVRSLRQELANISKLPLGQQTVAIGELRNKITHAKNETDKLSSSAKNATKNMTTLGSSTKRFGTFFSNLYSSMSTYSLGNIISMQMTKAIYGITDTIRELDKAFVAFNKVAPESFHGTAEEFDALREKAIEVGQDVARSSVDIINSTASALQLGIDDMDKALEYARNVNMYANVADVSEEQSDKYIKSIMSAYGGVDESLDEMTNKVKGAGAGYSLLNDYMDEANYAGNNFAVTSADIGEALMRSASAMKENGVEMSESIGLIIGAQETVQNAGKVGNSLKTMMQRLNGVTYSMKDGKIIANKTTQAFKELAGIEIVNWDTNEVRDAYSIFTDLNAKWDSMNDVQQNGIADALGGAHHLNTLQALMDNWDTVLQYQEEYQNGWTVGSAEKENERFINSIEGKIIKLKEEFNSLVTTTISTDSVKTFLDILTNILSVVNDIVGAFDDIGLSTPLMVSVIASAGKTIKALGTNTPLTMTFGNGIFSVLNKLGVQTQQTTTTIKDGENAQKGYRVALTNTANASALASLKTGLMTTAMTLLNTVITGVAIAGITLLVKAVMDYVNANEIAHDKIADAIEVTKSTISSYKQQKSELKDIAEEYDNLAGKSKLSNDELERYNQLQSQIAKLAPDLVVGYDADNNPILALNGSLEDYIDGLDDVIERQQKLLANQQNSLANKSRQELKNINRTTERTITPWNSADYSSAWNDLVPWNNAKLKNARDGADEYIKIIEKRNKAVDNLNIDLAESFEKFNSIEMEQQQSVLNKLGNEDRYENFNNLGKKTKNAMETLIDNFNWGSSVVETTAGQEKFIKNFDLLSEKIGKNTSQVQEWNKELATANSSWQQTGDLEQYKKDIHGVAQEIADLTDTNVDDWVTGFANELQGGLSESAISLNNFLKSYNKTFTDIEGEDKVALKLSLEYDATSEFLKDLTAEGQTYEEMVDWIVRVNSGELKYNGELPYQIKEMIKGSLDGGETLKDYESRLIMKVSTIIQSQGELDDKTFNLITKMLNGQLTDTEIKAGIELPDGTTLNSELIGTINEINKNKENNVKVGVELNKDRLNEDLKTILDGDDNKELRINLKTAVEDNKLETYNDLVKDMSEEKQIDIATAFVEYGDMTAEEFDNFIKNLPEEVQTAIKFIIDDGGIDDSIFNSNEVQTILVNVEDEDAYNKIFNLATELDKLDMNRDLKIDIVGNLGKGTTKGIIQALDSIKDLPDEQKMTIITNITSVMAGMEGLDKQQISDKIVEIKDEDDASDDIDKVQGETIDDKDVTINATDNASSIIDKIEQKELSDKELTIWMKVKESVTNAFNPLYNKFKDTLFKKSLNTSFTNISSTPEEADMGAKVNKAFTNLSTSPEITDTSDNTIGSTISNGISNFKAKALRPFGSVGSSTTLDTSINISKNTLDSIEYGVELLQELEYRIQNVNNKLDLLDVKMERAVGTEKIKYLQKQNELYTEQAKLQKELYDSLTEEKLVIKDKLRDYGFSFDAQGNLTKYEETLLKMEKKAEQLEESAKKASEKASNYETKNSSIDTSKYDTSKYNTTGKNLTKSEKAEMQKKKEAVNQAKKNAQAKAKAEAEASQKVKKSLESQADKAQEVSDEYKEKLESVKKLTEEYLQIQETDIGDAEREWQELQNAIKENNDEIERLELEDKLYKFKNSVTGLTNQYDIWADKIDLIDTKLNNSLETEKVALMGDKITALNKQLEFQEKILDSLKSQMSVYQDALSKYDVEFGAKGNITNMSTVLNKYQNSEDLEKINDLMEEYNDLVRDAIPNAEKEYAELNNTIQDVYDTQLETVKTIEDKITEVIKDQLDKRKELIQKQYDSEIDLLNKRKEEYNKSKETDDYYEDLEEAQEEINNIQKKINTVSLDDSLEGRSKLDEYLEDLKEAQDKYNELVANRTDTLINDMYDNEIDRLQEESESKIEDLENEWTDSKIAEIVAQSLGEGVFTDIDGEVHNLQDTLITFAEDSGEALGVLGDRIKNELSLNLQDALNYIKEYDEIINSMGLKQLGNVNYSDKVNSKSLAIDDISINVYGTESMNEKQLAEEVSKQIENKLSEITNGGLL